MCLHCSPRFVKVYSKGRQWALLLDVLIRRSRIDEDGEIQIICHIASFTGKRSTLAQRLLIPRNVAAGVGQSRSNILGCSEFLPSLLRDREMSSPRRLQL